MGRKHTGIIAAMTVMMGLSLLGLSDKLPEWTVIFAIPAGFIALRLVMSLTRISAIPEAEANREIKQVRIEDGSTTFVFEPTADGDVLREVEMKVGNQTFVYACSEGEKKA